MRRIVAVFVPVLVAVVLALWLPERLAAQDTLDVAPGYETLNLAVSSDTASGRIAQEREQGLSPGSWRLLSAERTGAGYRIQSSAHRRSQRAPAPGR